MRAQDERNFYDATDSVADIRLAMKPPSYLLGDDDNKRLIIEEWTAQVTDDEPVHIYGSALADGLAAFDYPTQVITDDGRILYCQEWVAEMAGVGLSRVRFDGYVERERVNPTGELGNPMRRG